MNSEMSTIKENVIWEERNLIEPEKNCLNNNVIEPKDITNEIKKDSTKKVWNGIGKVSGIYKIINKVNGKYYIGSSSNISKRWNSHKSLLIRKKHDNPHLQNAWNKCGKDNFECIIVEQIINDNLLLKEQLYLDVIKLNKQHCYNINFTANQPPNSIESRNKQRLSMKGKIPWNKDKIGLQKAWNKDKKGVSMNTRLKMSKKAKERVGIKNSNYSLKEYTFKNRLSNEIFKGTQNIFRKKYNLLQSSVSYLILGRYKSCNNWILINK